MFNLFILENVHNYIDPSIASAFVAAIIAVIAGFGITIKLYWEKLKSKLSRKD
jgi:hypothetical protein